MLPVRALPLQPEPEHAGHSYSHPCLQGFVLSPFTEISLPSHLLMRFMRSGNILGDCYHSSKYKLSRSFRSLSLRLSLRLLRRFNEFSEVFDWY